MLADGEGRFGGVEVEAGFLRVGGEEVVPGYDGWERHCLISCLVRGD